MSAPEVRAHYDRAAADYQDRFSHGWLGRLRQRERAALLELLDPQSGDVVLDAGCGTGFDALPLMERGCEVSGVDLSEGMVGIARERGVDASVADLHTLDLGRTFDKILCAGPLEFCESAGRVIHRLAAHLAPGGRLVLLFPPPTTVGHVYRAYHRVSSRLEIHLYPVDELAGWLRAAGLEPDELRRPGPFSAVMRAWKPA